MSDDLPARTQVASPPCRTELIGTENFYWKFPPGCWTRLSGNLEQLLCVCHVWKFQSFPLVISFYYKPDWSETWQYKVLTGKVFNESFDCYKLQVTQHFSNTEANISGWGDLACLCVLITTTKYQSFNIIFNKFSSLCFSTAMISLLSTKSNCQIQDNFISAISKRLIKSRRKYSNL